MKISKYENLKEELPKIQDVLLDSIQNDVLEIKVIDKECAQYMTACEKQPQMEDVSFVVYSKYLHDKYSQYEKFVFLNSEGKEIFSATGQEMGINGICKCNNLILSEDYKDLVDENK